MLPGIRSSFLAAAAALVVAGRPGSARAEEPDAAAAEVRERLVAAMGGRKAFDELPGLAFDFVVTQNAEAGGVTELARRSHVWDKWRSRHRLETKTPDGRPVVVIHSVLAKEDPAARVLIGGKAASEEAAATWTEKAYALWINDVYWLAMPWKLSDPGVKLTLRGEEKIGPRAFDVLELAFEGGTGLTPGDKYWLTIERGGGGLLHEWEYVLEGQSPPPVKWAWEDWVAVGGVRFSTRKRQIDGAREIRIEKLEALPADSDARFRDGGT